MANKSLKTLDIITVLMKNDRVREFKWLDTRSWEESRYNNPNSPKPELPTGFKLIKRSPLEVKKIADIEIVNKILQEKDNGKPAQIANLEDFDIYGIKIEDEILSLAIISHISTKEVEIKELITRKEYRHQGFGTKLLKQIVRKL